MTLAQRLRFTLIAAVAVLCSVPSHAVFEHTPFATQEQTERYQQLITHFRCPKCQNQSLSDSDAPIAKDLRQQVARMINEQASNQTINAFMVQRYGHFIVYKPPFNAFTVGLWLSPFLLAVIAMGWVWLLRARQHRERTEPLTAEEKAAIEQLLAAYPKR